MKDLEEHPDSDLLAAGVPALLLDTHADRIVAANARAQALLGADDLAGRAFAPRLGRHFPGFLVFLDEVSHRGEAWTRQIGLSDLAGEPVDCEMRGRLVQRGGKPLLVLSLIDLAEMEMHAAIAESTMLHRGGLLEWQRAQGFFSELERQNQLILNAAGEGIYGVNADGKTTFVNRAAQEMLGWTTEDLLGRDIHSMIHHHHLNGDAYPSHDCPIYQSFRYEQVNRIEDEVFWRKDGKPIRVEYVSTPIYDQKMLVGAVVIFRDITERKESERALHEAMSEVAALRDQLEQENAYLQEAITLERRHHDIIGVSPAIRQLLTKIELVSRTAANVLVTGESGTGKSLVAFAIHKDSDRRRRPLIHFKCAAVPPDTMESELFGHTRGAFPGALRDKPGKLELAHGGTLFLDDITEVPLEQQGQLLSALQDGHVRRVGEERKREVDIRVIASTSRALEREVAAGRFREDLYFHLNVFPIHCTPLRDRPDDIPPLAAHLLRLACKQLNRKPPLMTERTMRMLSSYRWPGNVRELGNVIERGAIVSTEGKLVVDLYDAPSEPDAANGKVMTEAEIERMKIANTLACLRETGGRVAGPGGAADLLGIRPTTLYSRIRTLGLTAADWT